MDYDDQWCAHSKRFAEDCRECDLEVEEWRGDIADAVLRHIDTMYPKMWEGVPKTARLSIRNTVINALATARRGF